MRKLFACIICSFLITESAFAISNATYGPIVADDTLWSIASKIIPANSNVSVQQVMLAIFYKNKEAFSCYNVNALEPGKILKLPDIVIDNVGDISKNQAYLEVEKQNLQWKKIGAKSLIKHKKSNKILKYKHNHKKAISVSLKPAKQPEVMVPSVQEIALINDVNNHLAAVESQNNIINTQMSQLREKINSIEQNIKRLEKQNLEEKNNFFSFFKPVKQYIAKLVVRLGKPLFTILFVGVVILLFLALTLLLPRRSKKTSQS